ncbi:SprT family zinc-dependent metalloprotease [Chitinivorax sp. PXF-14]|uniref:M48 family metallopeptidase n=1 Tax=Chitinivorax sp. PXF-14 TaxID=3230488 RepID=UPI0034668FA3
MPPPSSAQPRSIELAGQQVDYLLKRSATRRSLGLRVDHRGLTVSVPARTPESHIQTLLRDKAGWILDKLNHWQAPAVVPLEHGGTIWLLGEPLTLSVQPAGRASSKRDGDTVLLGLPAATAETVALGVTRWLQREARAYFLARTPVLAAALGVTPGKVLLSSAKTRWGSCNSRGEIRLNWRLIQAPAHLIDYVIVHELAHLLEMNHSPCFWSHVARLYPDYRRARAELKDLGAALHLL